MNFIAARMMLCFRFRHLLLALVLAAGVGCQKQPDTLIRAGYDQKEMDRAIARARKETDEFLKVLTAKDADSFSVKAPITDPNGTEHFWITDVKYENGVFVGLIGNDPGTVRNVKLGQEWRIKKEEISDWIFVRGNRIHGGYTIDPLLPRWEKTKADELRGQLVR
jgi:uncharacterized protein YegJ (DUF2314 family)